MVRLLKIITFLLVALLVFSLVGCSKNEKVSAPATPPPATDRIVVTSPIEGNVLVILAKKGQEVEKDQVIVWLNNSQIMTQIEQTMAKKKALEKAAVEDSMKPVLREKTVVVEQERGPSAADQQEILAAKANYQKMQNLYNQGAVARKMVEEAQANYEGTKARLAKSSTTSKQKVVEALPPENPLTPEVKKKLLEVQKTTDKLQGQLQKMRVRTPVDGTIVEILVKKGEKITKGQKLMVIRKRC